jgi:hypothetical protein
MRWYHNFCFKGKTILMIKSLAVVFILCIFIVSCAVQQPVVKDEKLSRKIPPGIDTLTTIVADSIFSLVAVDEHDANSAADFFDEANLVEDLADSLWLESQGGLVTGLDTLLALRQLSRAEIYLMRNPESYKQTKKLMKKLGKLSPQVLADVSKNLMKQGVGFFENAIRHHRFNMTYRQGFSKFLQKLAERTGDKNYLIRAAEEGERVVFVIKDQHVLYYDLGEIYFKLREWNNAFKNY